MGSAVDMHACPCVYVTRSSETKPEEPWALAAEGGAKGALASPLKFEKNDVIRLQERQPGFESACRRFCRKMML